MVLVELGNKEDQPQRDYELNDIQRPRSKCNIHHQNSICYIGSSNVKSID